MKPKIVLVLIYTFLIVTLLLLIYNKYEASVTGNFVINEGAIDSGKCNFLKLISSTKYNKPFLLKGNSLYLNPSLLYNLKMPISYKKWFNPSKPPILYNFDKNRSNLIIVGDSYTFGLGVPFNESYPAYLSKLVNLNVINLGVPAYNTKLELERFKEVGLKYHPRLVIIQYFSNDFEDDWFLYSFAENISTYLKTQREIYKEKGWVSYCYYPKIYAFYYNNFVNGNREELIKENIIQPLIEFDKLSKEYNFSLIIVSIPKNNWINLSHYGEVIDVTKDLNFTGWKPPFTLSKYNWHFSPRTNKELAEVLAKKIKEVLK